MIYICLLQEKTHLWQPGRQIMDRHGCILENQSVQISTTSKLWDSKYKLLRFEGNLWVLRNNNGLMD